MTGLAQVRPVEEEALADLKLALTEACSNSIRHAYEAGREGVVEIRYELNGEGSAVEVADEGSGFELDAVATANGELDEGGLGLAIIRSVTDELAIESHGQRLAPALRQVPELEPTERRTPLGAAGTIVILARVQLQPVNVGHKALGDYATIASRGLMDQIRTLAEPLAGKRVLHLSATAFGGGVAEINYTLVPLMRDAGLDTEWRVIYGQDEFFDVTKTIHNALQGAERGLTDRAAGGLPPLQPPERRGARRASTTS